VREWLLMQSQIGRDDAYMRVSKIDWHFQLRDAKRKESINYLGSHGRMSFF